MVYELCTVYMHAGDGQVPADVMEARPPAIARGGRAVARMQSWKDMADWLREYQNHWYLKATEISRMWTQIVQVLQNCPALPFLVPYWRYFLRSCYY